jgi:hypothetical protein
MRLYVRSANRRPDPEPLATDERAVVRVVIAGWVLLLILALVFRSELDEQGRGWWVWTPVVAIALGLYGFLWLGKRGR